MLRIKLKKGVDITTKDIVSLKMSVNMYIQDKFVENSSRKENVSQNKAVNLDIQKTANIGNEMRMDATGKKVVNICRNYFEVRFDYFAALSEIIML